LGYDSNYRIRTNYIKIEPEFKYNINTNLRYFFVFYYNINKEFLN